MKRLGTFLLAALLLFTVVEAAETDEMNIAMLDGGSALVEIASSRDASVVCAFYTAAGRLLSARVADGQAGSWDAWASIPAGAARLRCFLLDAHTRAPLCAPLEQTLPGEPVTTVTSGAALFGSFAFDPQSGQQYIGYELDETVAWFENGAPVERITRDAARGDVVELYDRDNNGRIDLVRVYRYAVDMADGEVVLSWSHPTKGVIHTEKARRVVGSAVRYTPSTGVLRLDNGVELQLSGIQGAPEDWEDFDGLKNRCVYYLDKNGSACRIEPFHGGIDGSTGGGGGSSSPTTSG